MLRCQNCGAEYTENNNFCEFCGAKLEKVVSQDTVVEQPIAVETPVAQPEIPVAQPEIPVAQPEIPVAQPEIPVVEQPVVQNSGFNVDVTETYVETVYEEPKKKKSVVKKLLLIGLPCIAVILAAIIVFQMFFFKKPLPNYVFYLKDGELWFTNASKISPREISQDLNDGSPSVHISNDGKYIFFYDKIDEDKDYKEGNDLYYIEAKDKKSEPVKIDSDVVDYSISKDGKTVTYLKGGEKSSVLYQHNLKEKTKIEDDVTRYYVSIDGDKLYYLTAEGELYLKNGKKTADKISDEVEYFVVNNDFDTVFYMDDDDTLYKQEGNKDNEKISSDVVEVLQLYDSGEAYYYKEVKKTVKPSDYVEDDLKSSDAAITEPVRPTAPNYQDYRKSVYNGYYSYTTTDWDAYDAAYERYQDALEEYYDKYDLYQEKLMRDELRQEIANAESVEKSTYELYYYDGKEEKKICETLGDIETYGDFKYDTSVMVYTSVMESEVSKIKFSEINYVSDITAHINSAEHKVEYYVVVEGESTKIDTDKEYEYEFEITDDGKTIYYLSTKEIKSEDYADWDEYYDDKYAQEAELYKIEISGKKVKSTDRIDGDVSFYCGLSIIDNMVKYYKDYNYEKSEGTLYFDGKEVSEDAFRYYTYYIEDTETLYFMTDYNDEPDKQKGTLKMYKKGKETTIADDVYYYYFTPANELIYLKDYKIKDDRKKSEGDLYYFDGKKSEKIDTDVYDILSPYFYSEEQTYDEGDNYHFASWYEEEHKEVVEEVVYEY